MWTSLKMKGTSFIWEIASVAVHINIKILLKHSRARNKTFLAFWSVKCYIFMDHLLMEKSAYIIFQKCLIFLNCFCEQFLSCKRQQNIIGLLNKSTAHFRVCFQSCHLLIFFMKRFLR